jgi:uncharacterized membrane protein YcaP (DUF421 family)
MFFNSWGDLLRILIVGTAAYAGLVLFLRVSGKRTLSKMNAFDLVVTVAFGSTLASTLLSSDVSLSEGLTAFALLILLQFVSTWMSVRFPWYQRIIKARPRLLAFDGEVDPHAMKEERVTQEELAAAIRDSGVPNVQEARAIVMETDGSIAVIARHEEVDRYDSLEHVRGLPDHVADQLRNG